MNVQRDVFFVFFPQIAGSYRGSYFLIVFFLFVYIFVFVLLFSFCGSFPSLYLSIFRVVSAFCLFVFLLLKGCPFVQISGCP